MPWGVLPQRQVARRSRPKQLGGDNGGWMPAPISHVPNLPRRLFPLQSTHTSVFAGAGVRVLSMGNHTHPYEERSAHALSLSSGRKSRVFRLSSNPPSLSPQRESGARLDPFSPLFSPQRESRAIVPFQLGSYLQKSSSWDVNLSIRRVLVGITVLVHNRGSGFPLRRE